MADSPFHGQHLSPRVTWRETVQLMKQDYVRLLKRFNTKPYEELGTLQKVSCLITTSAQCVLLHRLAHWVFNRVSRRLGLAIAFVNRFLTKATIHPGSRIGPGLFIPHTAMVMFFGTAGSNLILFPHTVVAPLHACFHTRHPRFDQAPMLGDQVSLSALSAAIGPIHLFDKARVSVGTLCTQDVPVGGTVMTSMMSRPGKSRQPRGDKVEPHAPITDSDVGDSVMPPD
jgi:serine O-acetyltransferase